MTFINGTLVSGRLPFQIIRERALVLPGGRVVVVIAALLQSGQLSSEAGDDECFNPRAGPTGAHLDAVMNQIVERALPNAVAPDNENLDTLFTQPPGKRTWFMRRCFDDLCANNYTAVSIRFDQCELLGFPKMAEEAAINNWNGNFQIHSFTVAGVSWLIKFLPAARANNSSNSRRDNSPMNS